jgi:hypothetical protein
MTYFHEISKASYPTCLKPLNHLLLYVGLKRGLRRLLVDVNVCNDSDQPYTKGGVSNLNLSVGYLELRPSVFFLSLSGSIPGQ